MGWWAVVGGILKAVGKAVLSQAIGNATSKMGIVGKGLGAYANSKVSSALADQPKQAPAQPYGSNNTAPQMNTSSASTVGPAKTSGLNTSDFKSDVGVNPKGSEWNQLLKAYDNKDGALGLAKEQMLSAGSSQTPQVQVSEGDDYSAPTFQGLQIETAPLTGMQQGGPLNSAMAATGTVPISEMPFDPRGRSYDYVGAIGSGMKPESNGHWGSKGRGHDTWNLMQQEETRMGNRVVMGKDGRYYSVGPNTPLPFAQYY